MAIWGTDHMRHYLISTRASERTVGLYRLDLVQFLDWCERHSIDPSTISSRELSIYRVELLDSGAAESTVERRVQTVERFYRWLLREGLVVSVPVVRMPRGRKTVFDRETLRVEELRRMWRAASDDRDRALLALLGFNSLRAEEVMSASVTDMTSVEGSAVLRLPNRKGPHELAFTVLTPEVDEILRRLVGDRRTGHLVLNRYGNQLNRNSIKRIINRLATDANVGFHVTSLTLTFSMRAIAIEHGFSYVSVVRAVGETGLRRVGDMALRARNPITAHAALRMARLVMSPGDEVADLLAHAEIVLRESDVPPAAAVMLAGATLERHLRDLCGQKGVELKKPERKRDISAYAHALHAASVIALIDLRRIEALAAQRNNAAHGWFERVDSTEAQQVIAGVGEVASRYPFDE